MTETRCPYCSAAFELDDVTGDPLGSGDGLEAQLMGKLGIGTAAPESDGDSVALNGPGLAATVRAHLGHTG